MATPKKDPKDYLKRGQPTSYKSEYCEKLIEHMSKGCSFESFAADVDCDRTTLYNWCDAHPEFFNAKKRGLEKLLKFYEELGRTMCLGQLRRIKSEKVRVGPDGKPMYDNSGQLIIDREYEQATPNATAYVWLTKNILKWTDRSEVTLEGGKKPIQTQDVTELTDAQLKERIEQMRSQLNLQ